LAAQDVRKVAEQLRGQRKDTPARVADEVADRAESFGAYLRDADGERLLRNVEDVARRQPWLVAASGLALGLRLAVPEGLQQATLPVPARPVICKVTAWATAGDFTGPSLAGPWLEWRSGAGLGAGTRRQQASDA